MADVLKNNLFCNAFGVLRKRINKKLNCFIMFFVCSWCCFFENHLRCIVFCVFMLLICWKFIGFLLFLCAFRLLIGWKITCNVPCVFRLLIMKNQLLCNVVCVLNLLICLTNHLRCNVFCVFTWQIFWKSFVLCCFLFVPVTDVFENKWFCNVFGVFRLLNLENQWLRTIFFCNPNDDFQRKICFVMYVGVFLGVTFSKTIWFCNVVGVFRWLICWKIIIFVMFSVCSNCGFDEK